MRIRRRQPVIARRVSPSVYLVPTLEAGHPRHAGTARQAVEATPEHQARVEAHAARVEAELRRLGLTCNGQCRRGD